MKRQIILLICILFIGGLVILLPSFFSSYLDRKEVEKIKTKEQTHYNNMQDISSNIDTIDESEISQDERELEIYNENQMFFEGIENLYDYFLFGQVEDIKEKTQFYIQNYISKDLLDCKLVTGSIIKDDNTIIFNLDMKDVSSFEVKIKIDNDGNIVDITILHSI